MLYQKDFSPNNHDQKVWSGLVDSLPLCAFQVLCKTELNYPTARPSQRDKRGYRKIQLVSSIKDNGNLLSVTFQVMINIASVFVESIFASLATQQSDSGINT